MNKTASTVASLHATSFTLFFIINTILEYFVYPTIEKAVNSNFWLIFISTIISASLYSLIYMTSLFIYKAITFKVITKKIQHDKLWVKGTWYHVHVPYDNFGEMEIDTLRAGETTFEQTLFDVRVKVAKNDSYAVNEQGEILKVGDRHTEWHYPYNFVLNGEKLNVIYSAGATHDTRIVQHRCSLCGTEFPEGKEICLAGQERLGIHSLTIEDENTIIGRYRDAAPSVNHGTIKFFRNIEDRDKEIKDYFKRLEYKKQKENEKKNKF